jgi:hypothetical protein
VLPSHHQCTLSSHDKPPYYGAMVVLNCCVFSSLSSDLCAGAACGIVWGWFSSKWSMVQLVKIISGFVSSSYQREQWAGEHYVKVVHVSLRTSVVTTWKRQRFNTWRCERCRRCMKQMQVEARNHKSLADLSAEIRPSPRGDVSKNRHHQALLKKSTWRSAS